MLKFKLAEDLRSKQLKWACSTVDISSSTVENFRRAILSIPDEEIIRSYLFCPKCNQIQVNEFQLEQYIKMADSVHEFIELCDRHGRLGCR